MKKVAPSCPVSAPRIQGVPAIHKRISFSIQALVSILPIKEKVQLFDISI